MKNPNIKISIFLVLVLFGASYIFAGEGRFLISGQTTITQPGSYRVTQDISVSTGAVITIQADNVTLDLDGHTLSSSDPAVPVISSGNTGIKILNGKITAQGGGISYDSQGGFLTLKNIDILILSDSGTGVSLVGDCVSAQGRVSFMMENVTIRGTIIVGAGSQGMYAKCIQGSILRNNHIVNHAGGVVLDDVATSLIIGNQVSDTIGNGFSITGVGNTFLNNVVSSSSSTDAFGFGTSSQPISQMMIFLNESYASARGISLYGSMNALSWNSTIHGGTGLYISQNGSEPNIYSHNRSLGNFTDCNISLNNVDGGRNCDSTGCTNACQ